MIGVWVEFVHQKKWNGRDDGPFAPARRICWNDDKGKLWTDNTKFRRRRDAEMGLSYLEKKGYTRRDFLNAPEGPEMDAWVPTMLEGLAW